MMSKLNDNQKKKLDKFIKQLENYPPNLEETQRRNAEMKNWPPPTWALILYAIGVIALAIKIDEIFK